MTSLEIMVIVADLASWMAVPATALAAWACIPERRRRIRLSGFFYRGMHRKTL